MTWEEIYQLPHNLYIITLGVGVLVIMLTVILCCYLFRLRRQEQREPHGYEVVLKRAGKKLSLLGQMCAVCLEEFQPRDELGLCPCDHAFHKRCLVKWLEIRSVCPMCNTPVSKLQSDDRPDADGPPSLQEV